MVRFGAGRTAISVIGLVLASAAHAQDAAANAIKSQLVGMAGPALGLAVIVFGWRALTNEEVRPSQVFLVIIGFLIVIGGGFLSR